MQGVALPPPPVESARRGGGRGGDWVELTRARDDIDAHLLAGRLAEAGVAARTFKDRHAPGAWLYGGSNPWAPVVVLVRRLQLDDARLLLERIARDAPRPRGHGLAGEPPALGWWVVALALALALSATTIAQVAGQLSGD